MMILIQQRAEVFWSLLLPVSTSDKYSHFFTYVFKLVRLLASQRK